MKKFIRRKPTDKFTYPPHKNPIRAPHARAGSPNRRYKKLSGNDFFAKNLINRIVFGFCFVYLPLQSESRKRGSYKDKESCKNKSGRSRFKEQ